jgi:hypothetical protein
VATWIRDHASGAQGALPYFLTAPVFAAPSQFCAARSKKACPGARAVGSMSASIVSCRQSCASSRVLKVRLRFRWWTFDHAWPWKEGSQSHEPNAFPKQVFWWTRLMPGSGHLRGLCWSGAFGTPFV